MRASAFVVGLSALALLVACGGDGAGPIPQPSPTPAPVPTPTPTPAPTPGPKPTLGAKVVDFSFLNDMNGFQANYSDYVPGQEPVIAFRAEIEPLPAPLANLTGFAISAPNPSNDLFIFIWKPVTGLAPNTRYQVTVSLRFATNAPPNCPGNPGENVTIKAGASAVQPATVAQLNRVTVNFDKGNQATGGADVAAIGNFAQVAPAGTCDQPLYAEKTLTTGAGAPTLTSDANGRLWLVIGADSGFTGRTRIYFLDGQATFAPVSG
jgi:hypothetical protein